MIPDKNARPQTKGPQEIRAFCQVSAYPVKAKQKQALNPRSVGQFCPPKRVS